MSMDRSRSEKDKELILSIIKYLLVTAIVLAVLYFGARIVLILLPVVFGFVLAHISNSVSLLIYKLFRRKSPDKDLILSDRKGYKTLRLLSFAFLLLTLTLFIILIIIALIAQVRNLIVFINNTDISLDFLEVLADRIRDFSENLGGFLPSSTIESITSELLKIQDYLIESIPKLATFLLNSLLGVVGNIPLAIFRVVVVILSGYYFISDRKTISNFIHSTLPSKAFVSKITSAITKVFTSLFRVLGGYILILTITFLEALIALLIIRMPYAVVLALLVTLIDVLPAVGASACFVPISIYMFSQGRIWEGIVALAFVGIIIAVRAFIEPKIIGSAMKLHPLVTLVAMILGLSFFGIIGFVAGPVLLVLILGIVDSFGFEESIRNKTGQLLNKISSAGKIISDIAIENSPVRYVEMWNFDEKATPENKSEFINKIGDSTSVLSEKIETIINIESGSDINFGEKQWDFLLIVDFSSYDDLNKYKNDLHYLELKEFIENFSSEKKTFDYKVKF